MDEKIYINSKLKRCYEKFEVYQELEEQDKGYFDQLCPILWLENEINYPNKFLASRFGYAESTIEKKHKRLERGHLIVRKIERYKDVMSGRWQTTRRITLDPVFKAKLTELVGGPNVMSKVAKDPELEEQEIVVEDPATEIPEPSSKPTAAGNGKSKFNLGNRRW